MSVKDWLLSLVVRGSEAAKSSAEVEERKLQRDSESFCVVENNKEKKGSLFHIFVQLISKINNIFTFRIPR